MSEKQPVPLQDALKVAREIQHLLTPVCKPGFCIIAGSIRREKPMVKDIEILYVPKRETRPDPDNMFGTVDVNLADEMIGGWLAKRFVTKRPGVDGRTTWGDNNKLAVHSPSGIALDLFATKEENWWNSLVVRTGSKETNLQLTNGAQRLGRSLVAYGCGIKILTSEQIVNNKPYRNGDIIPTFSERDVFELCGVPFREPHNR